jgi:ribonuclease I
MSEKNSGGPAFPMAANEYAGHGPCWGMTLRDYFAAKAIGGLLADPNVKIGADEIDHVAELCYRMADAMIRAREA